MSWIHLVYDGLFKSTNYDRTILQQSAPPQRPTRQQKRGKLRRWRQLIQNREREEETKE